MEGSVKKVAINEIEYGLQMSDKVLEAFENVVNNQMCNSTLGKVVLVYSALIASNKSFDMELDDFIKYCDNHFAEYSDMITWLRDNTIGNTD